MPETAAQTTAANQQVIDQATTGVTAPATQQPSEFTHKFADGRTISAATQGELLAKVADRYDHLYSHTETLKGENAQFRQSVAQLATGQQPQTNGFSQEKYLEMWTKNPLEANQYLNAHDPTINAAVNQLEQIQWQQQAGQFREANPDFKMTTDNINHLSRVCDQMFPGTKVVTAVQMEAAHLYCQKQKLYGEGTVTQTTQAPPPPPPPGTGTDTQGAPDITKMDQAQLRQYIESLEQK